MAAEHAVLFCVFFASVSAPNNINNFVNLSVRGKIHENFGFYAAPCVERRAYL